MKNYFLLLLGFTCFSVEAQISARTPEQDSLIAQTRRASQADHRKMLDRLGIAELRPGVSNRVSAPNAANYDEAKANPFPNLPDALILKNGKKVTTSRQWWKQRRPEIVEDFDREIYGREPGRTPDVRWEVLSVTDSTNGAYPIKIKRLLGQVDNTTYPAISVELQMIVVTPTQATGSVPLILELAYALDPVLPPVRVETYDLTWQQQLLVEGWGYAQLLPTSFQADNGAGLTQGIIGLMNKGQSRQPDDWGTLRAWAWGASRVLDYFEKDKEVDAKRVGIEGHSRFGKAALVAMAYDPRFATAFISSSGEGGAKLHRRNYGEVVENVAASNLYHWMAGNFLKYAGPLGWNDLPVDSHELIALCAPRPVFIGSGDEGDQWVDARGMFMAASEAGEVYEILGKKGLGTDAFPAVKTALINGDLGFRQHAGGHTPTPNWPVFIKFVEKYF